MVPRPDGCRSSPGSPFLIDRCVAGTRAKRCDRHTLSAICPPRFRPIYCPDRAAANLRHLPYRVSFVRFLHKVVLFLYNTLRPALTCKPASQPVINVLFGFIHVFPVSQSGRGRAASLPGGRTAKEGAKCERCGTHAVFTTPSLVYSGSCFSSHLQRHAA